MPKRTTIIEKRIRDILAKRYGKIFPSDVKRRTLLIGKMPYRFDIVSEDKTIVGEIKSVSITNEKAYRTTMAKRRSRLNRSRRKYRSCRRTGNSLSNKL